MRDKVWSPRTTCLLPRPPRSLWGFQDAFERPPKSSKDLWEAKFDALGQWEVLFQEFVPLSGVFGKSRIKDPFIKGPLLRSPY
jgi:hypothetical protein